MDAKTGIITTVAGDFAADKANDGLGGFSGDGGPATSAQLNDPQGVAVDGAGDLFIADTFNNAIREVTPAGTITTVVNAATASGGIPPAGGESSGAAPTASRLNTPYGVAIDQSHRRPVHRRHRQQQDRRGHRPGPARQRGRPDRPGSLLTRPLRDEEETSMTDKAHASRPARRMTRRTFVASAAAVAGAAGLAGVLPANLARAATRSPGEFDLSQVKHLVFLMQENRSFDHYFGTFPGARGFNDPTAIRLPTGRSVFQQPDPANPDGYLEPYHMSTITTGAAAVPSLSHDWRDQHASWNQGAMDGWLLTHVASDGDANGSFTMGYYTQEDIPFHWALAKAFTLRGQLPLLGHGPDRPEPALLGDGGNDPQGKAGGPVLETGGVKDLTYETGYETLFNAGYSFKWYHASGWIGPSDGNYFKQFQTPGLVPAALFNAVKSTSTLFGNGTPGGIGDPVNPTPASNPELAFEEDCANGVLPDVSFIGSPARRRAPAGASRRPAPSSSPPSWRPWPPTRTCGTAPCSSSTTTRTTGSSTTSSRPPRTRRSTPRSSSPWPRRPAPPAAACRSAPGSGSRPSSSRRGRSGGQIFSERLRPHLLPAADRGGGGGRRPVRQGPRSPSPTSAAGGGQDLQRLHRVPGRGRRSRPRRAPSSTPPPRRPTWPPRPTASLQPLPPRPGATQQMPKQAPALTTARRGPQGGCSPCGPGA